MSCIIITPTPQNVEKTVAALQRGNIVAFPTETVFGLGVDAANETAIEKLYALKGRSAEKALQIMVENVAQAEHIAQMDKRALTLALAFWPGPLTMVVKRKKGAMLASSISKDNTIGLRIPDHPVALKLLSCWGRPLAATSANLSGRAPAVTAEMAATLDIPFALVGACELQQSSTVIDMTKKEIRVLREGLVTLEQIEVVLNSGT